MRVLVIPEDFRKDAFLLEPLVAAMFAHLGKPRARVRVCRNPLLGAVSQALSWERIQEILDLYPMVDLFLLCVDRDGVVTREQSLRRLEARAAEHLSVQRGFLAENAWQELEVWALAGQDLPPDWSWSEVRQEVNPKERYFEPYAASRGMQDEPGGGRRTLALEAAQRYTSRVRMLCPEDVAGLEARIARWLARP
jgi:hypothetical protein